MSFRIASATSRMNRSPFVCRAGSRCSSGSEGSVTNLGIFGVLNTVSRGFGVSDTRLLARQVLATAVTARKQREEVVSVATWVSYVLYTLGWSLGLAGRLCGEDDAEMPE